MDDGAELVDVEGFGQVFGGSGQASLEAIEAAIPSRQHHNGQSLKFGDTANGSTKVQAIHFGHGNVEQNHGNGFLIDQGERLNGTAAQQYAVLGGQGIF